MKKHATRIDKLVKSPLWQDFLDYLNFWHRYVKNRAYIPFSFFEAVKDFLVVGLYKDRGKKARPILHLGAMGMTFFVVIFAPLLFEKRDSEIDERRGNVLAASSNELSFYTIQAEEVKRLRGGEVVLHEVKEGEDLAGIASLYGLKKETIMWENNLRENSKLSVGSNLRILPVDGVYHKVSKGESVESIGKKYGLEAAQTQAIVDFPFNEFLNDKFELAPGQWLMIPWTRTNSFSEKTDLQTVAIKVTYYSAEYVEALVRSEAEKNLWTKDEMENYAVDRKSVV